MNKREMRKLYPLLKIVSKLPDDEKKILLHYLSHDGCRGIYECIQNGLTNPTLTSEDKNALQSQLFRHKNKFRKLLKEQDPEKKKRVLLQVGEGVGLILDKVVPLLHDFLNKTQK
jgi:hypothetical protein